uniref:NADH-ubiquinone oxidoreductase chain 1 n=1 Tax=Corbicula japonica TaxID=141464 RepID=A0A8H2SDL0_9BIVA|nr:NADH dehydrogenase subunit 1 [Corbicula japonica]QWS05864.1 NADH dehydrogenase subunit 1 [Corbicula japonica]UIF91962.1 NADH dehydrogenase subunit 1 [Corbicula japonica]UXG18801.1 NADH dehydrogenase subunit 1 [Corbicula japonica]
MISCCLVTVLMLVAVAFFIVTERKGLGMLQIRQGPNKVSVKGILQAVADGVKLFKKEFSYPFSCNKELFLLGPVICFFCAYSLWLLFPSSIGCLNFESGLLFFLCISCFSVYGVFITGWVCDSRYAFLGAMRAVAQSISYEVFLSTALFLPLLLVGSFDFQVAREGYFSSVLLGQEVLLLWLISVLAETNRAPFDFVEGESELVAGYSVEFGGVGFALIALAEYSNIMFMSMITGVLFFGGLMGSSFFGSLVMAFWMTSLSYFIVWVRGVVPRFRYDLLMSLCWVILLPVSLSLFCVGVVLSL